jgi:hypothetical protein
VRLASSLFHCTAQLSISHNANCSSRLTSYPTYPTYPTYPVLPYVTCSSAYKISLLALVSRSSIRLNHSFLNPVTAPTTRETSTPHTYLNINKNINTLQSQ